jgi:hypothetical protein
MKKKPAATTRKSKPFRLELSWSGMFGLVVVCFCLFLWMFLLGMWAGQVIFPPVGEVHGVDKGGGPASIDSGKIATISLAGQYPWPGGLIPFGDRPVS